MTDWLCITTEEHWELCLKNKTWGVKGRKETKNSVYGLDKLNDSKPGDNLVFHVTKKGIIGTCKVDSGVFHSEERIWKDGTYSARVKFSLSNIFHVAVPWNTIGEKITDADTGKSLKGSYIQWKSMIRLAEGDLDIIKAVENDDL